METSFSYPKLGIIRLLHALKVALSFPTNVCPFVHMNSSIPSFLSLFLQLERDQRYCGLTSYFISVSVIIEGLKRVLAGRVDHLTHISELQSGAYSCVIACMLIMPQLRICAVSDTAGLSEH